MSISAILALSLLLTTASAGAEPVVDHTLKVTLRPARHELTATDRVRLPAADRGGKVTFALHKALEIVAIDGARLRKREGPSATSAVPVQRYIANLPEGNRQFTVEYRGRIHHPVSGGRDREPSAIADTPGLIDKHGVLLGGESRWYPSFHERRVAFSLELNLPPGWDAVSQGRRVAHQRNEAGTRVTWAAGRPQEQIYLVVGPFHPYMRESGEVTAMAFLRQADQELANRYLGATARYIAMYSDLLGPYPYAKFALVENFWETGFGMPSFTLLGPKVMRLPFILHTSYPHEILHNWWGNGVYVDVGAGNWAEGLTTYLSDHLSAVQRGEGAQYRRSILRKYADHVASGEDRPLSAFVARHDAVSNAVGYSKAMMLFHMLRRHLGDEAFVTALRTFYEQYRFRRASFYDLQEVFAESDRAEAIEPLFDQWVRRAGAPGLRVTDVDVQAQDGRYRLRGRLHQTQEGGAYHLEVPVAVQMSGYGQAKMAAVTSRSKRTRFDLSLPAKPEYLQVDPQYDVFRRLDWREIPPALGGIFGAEKVTLVLPRDASRSLRTAWKRFAERWRHRWPDVRVVGDARLQELPADRAVWLLGWENRFAAQLRETLEYYPVRWSQARVELPEARLERAKHSVVLTARHPRAPRRTVAWLATERPAALPGLARKLPHYGKYSYLGFKGEAPHNIAKGQWPVRHSPLGVSLSEGVPALEAELPVGKPLTKLPPAPQEQSQQTSN